MVFHPTQKTVASDTHRFRVVNCGRRWGKTTLAIYEMLAKGFAKDEQKICYISPTFQQSRDIAWQELKKAAQPVLVSANESRLELTIKTQQGGNSSLWLRGWEAVDTLRGQHFDFLVIDEVASMRNFWINWQEVLRPTLTDSKGEALFISTPKGFSHFYDLFNKQNDDSDFKSFHFTSYENSYIPKEEIDKARRELTEDRFAQEFLADFRKTEGLVYKEFKRETHLFDSLDKVPNKLERIVGIDWGYTNPTAIVVIERDYDSNFWVVDEWYKTGKTTQEVIEYVKTLGVNICYPDPAEPDRLEECRRAGLNVREVNKDVTKGIDAVRTLFKNNKIKIWRNCVNLIQELETYSYKEKLPFHNEPEEPVKEKDHALDALRYALFMQGARVEHNQAAIRYPTQLKRYGQMPIKRVQ